MLPETFGAVNKLKNKNLFETRLLECFFFNLKKIVPEI